MVSVHCGPACRAARAFLPALACALALALGARAYAQPQVPATFYGSVSVDGQPVPEGTEVRGFVGGKDCTQGGRDAPRTIITGGVSAYVIAVMHESQEPGCARAGTTVTFTIAGRTANQTATWEAGPRQLDLNAGSGPPLALPTAAPTPPPDPTRSAATATAAAQFTPKPATALPTDPIRLGGTPPGRGGDPASGTAGPAPEREGGFPVLGALLAALAVIAVTGTAAGIALSRRGPRRPGGGPEPG
jgi:hypothetical protein